MDILLKHINNRMMDENACSLIEDVAKLDYSAKNASDELSLKEAVKLMYTNSGSPLRDRSETVKVINALIGTVSKNTLESDHPRHIQRPSLSNVYGNGPMLVSDVPAVCKGKEGVVVGIDEAGRGSVLGPMVYGAAYWHPSSEDKIPKDFNDSKQLSEDKRSLLLNKILETPEIGFAFRLLHASEISRNMLRSVPYNLNQMSHDAAIGMIRQLLAAGVKIDTCFIDTVGNASTYKRRLMQEFPMIKKFVVESKADANYAPCSAGSVVAKVLRDRVMENFQFSEPHLEAGTKFGSGYPSDPICKKWMSENLSNAVFGYPDVVRFSWGPTKNALEENGVAVTFAADEDDEDGQDWAASKRQQEQMSSFLVSGDKQQGRSHKRRYPFFERHGLEAVTKL